MHVVERIRGVDRETDQDHVRVRVGQGTETVVVFLACRIPESQFDMLAVNFDIGDIVLEHGRDVDLVGSSIVSKRSSAASHVGR